jgi:tetratricopeptide (TPR) repeat protein
MLPPAPCEACGYSSAVSSAETGFAGTRAAATGGGIASRSAGGPIPVGSAFGPRYHIIKQLGAGGMGIVYHAWDEELGVAVALKVIRPEVMGADDAGREVERRFKRELVLARQVTHKHVVRIHDLGEIEGIKYLTMPFVEGEDLAALLKRQGKIPVQRVLQIARQVADGLAAAHEVGVVHRDLKPENVMIDTDGNAQIMDFGIARSVSGTGTATALGAVIGTLEYMAPEQAQGQHLDHRADIYAFGLILYDMLAGRQRLARVENPMAEMMLRIQKPPAPLRSLDPGIPEALEAVVMKCLKPDPAARYETTADLVKALSLLDHDGHALALPAALPPPARQRHIPIVAAAAVLIVALAVLGVWIATRNRSSSAPQPTRQTLKVLVANFRNDAHEEVFDGLLEQAIAVGIEGAPFVTVYPRRDALRAAERIGSNKTLDEATARLVAASEGIDVLVAGAVARSGSEYRITVNALDPASDKYLLQWSDDVAAKDAMLAAVGKAAAKVRSALGDQSADEERPRDAETFTAGSLEAAKAYARAQEFQWAGKPDEAIAQYLQAVQLDPEFGRAHSGLAALFANRGRRAEAEQYYKTALSKIDRMTEREQFRTRGGYFLFQRKPDNAIREFNALLEKFPADNAGITNLAYAYFLKRDMAQALSVGQRSVDLYPKDVLRRSNLALYALYAGEYERAAKESAEVVAQSPVYVKGYVTQALAQLAMGNVDRARELYAKLAAAVPAQSYSAIGLADVSMYQGRLQEAAGTLDAGIRADEQNQAMDPMSRKRLMLASIHNLAGRKPAAVALADAAERQSGADDVILYSAGRVYVDAGQIDRARKAADTLGERLGADSRLYQRLLEGEIALASNRAKDAVASFTESLKLADSWLGHLGLGRAYLQASLFTEAQAEFATCKRRSGEATAVFFDDVPSYHEFPPVYYYLALAEQGMGSPAPAEFNTFLDIKKNGDEQGLVADARRRVK